MKKVNLKRVASLFMVGAIVMTSFTLPDKVSAAGSAVDETNCQSTEVSISNAKASNDSSRGTGDSYDGYVASVTESKYAVSSADYIKVVCTMEDVTNLTSESELLVLQPYDTSWGGWEKNIVYYNAEDYDATSKTYTAYVKAAPVVASLSTGKTLQGVNVSFASEAISATITKVCVLKEQSTEEQRRAKELAEVSISDQTLQEFTLSQLNAVNSDLTYAKTKSVNCKVYVHVTEAGDYARLKIRGGNLSTNSFSNKELVARYGTYNSGNSPKYIHLGYRTSGGYGSGMGVAESGNYLFTSTNMKKSTDESNAGVRLCRLTTDVNAYIIGIVYEGVGSVSISAPDEDGNVTITKGFDESAANIEDSALDSSDYSDDELSEAEKEKQAALEETRQEWRTGLGNAITKAEALEEADYTAESYAAVKDSLATALTNAKNSYNNEKDTKANYRKYRDALCDVMAKLVPVAETDASSAKDFRILSKTEVVAEMGAGINLGNTFDGGLINASETGWQAYKTTKEYITALHDAGYNTVRIPVTWNGYINEDYSIDEAWISRVQEVVDYCIDQDMYVIINIHHDGAANHDTQGNNPECWLNTASSDIDSVYEEYAGVWKTIAERFKDYDEHLIFESMNEVTDEHVLSTIKANEDGQILMNLNQIFVNTVRSTGSNNTKRWLALTGRFATAGGITTLPSDSLADDSCDSSRLMFAVHIYKDNSSDSWAYDRVATWWSSLSSTVKTVAALKDADGNAIGSEVPIYVGEYGVRTKALKASDTGYNNHERAENYEMCTAAAASYGVAAIVWDQGTSNYSTVSTETGLFTDWNRPALAPVYDDVVEATIRGTYCYDGMDLASRESYIYTSYGHTSTKDTSVVTEEKAVTEATTIDVSATSVALTAGERTSLTATTDADYDPVLWSSDNSDVATVFNGLIHAKKAGVTTIYAYSQSKSVKQAITVVVAPTGNETCTAISTDQEVYTVERGTTAQITTSLTPADSTDSLTYVSSNKNVAKVSAKGVISAEATGETYITISAASGVTTIVKVVVTADETYVDLALHAYLTCGDQVGSQTVRVNGDGQYSLTFDCTTDLDDTAAKAGITALKDITSIYIKDCNASNPIVSAAQIRYDKIILNDTEELTITNTDFKSAVKASGVFDTNDPINGWDGSVVKEITTSNHQVNFSTVSNPTKITVVFTLQNMVFEGKADKSNKTTSLTSETDKIITLEKAGDTAEIKVALSSADSDSEVTAFAANTAVASVDTLAQSGDENGQITIKVTAVGTGTTTLAVLSENGQMLLFGVAVGTTMTEKDIVDPVPDNVAVKPVVEPVVEPEEPDQPVTPDQPSTDIKTLVKEKVKAVATQIIAKAATVVTKVVAQVNEVVAAVAQKVNKVVSVIGKLFGRKR